MSAGKKADSCVDVYTDLSRPVVLEGLITLFILHDLIGRQHLLFKSGGLRECSLWSSVE
jgi:hypothetical protein